MFRVDKINNDYPTLQKSMYINLVSSGILQREVHIMKHHLIDNVGKDLSFIDATAFIKEACQYHFNRSPITMTDVLNHITSYKMFNIATDLNNNVVNCDSSYFDYLFTLITAYSLYKSDPIRTEIIKNCMKAFIKSLEEIYG